MSIAKILEKQLKALSKWVSKADNRTLLFDRSVARIFELRRLAAIPPSICGPLSQIAVWELKTGQHQLLSKDILGWQKTVKGYAYLWWANRLNFQFLNRGLVKQIYFFNEMPFHVLLHAIMAQDENSAAWLGDQLSECVSKEDKRVIGWGTNEFTWFSCWLYQLSRGINDVRFRNKFGGPYEEIASALESKQKLEAAVFNMCEFHLEKSVEEDGYSDFFHPFYNIFPIEVLAVFEICRQNGMTQPTVEHPLLKLPFSFPPLPQFAGNYHDEVLDSVIEATRHIWMDEKAG